MVFHIYIHNKYTNFGILFNPFFSLSQEILFTCKALTCLEIKPSRQTWSVDCWFGFFPLLWIAGVTNCQPYLSQLLSVWLTLWSCVEMFAATEWNQILFLPWRFWRKFREKCITSELLALCGINYCILNIKCGAFVPKSF